MSRLIDVLDYGNALEQAASTRRSILTLTAYSSREGTNRPEKRKSFSFIVAGESVMARLQGLVLIGVIVALLGLVGMAVPYFTTSQTRDVVKLGDLKVTAQEETTHVIPPLLSQGALVIGIVLIGVGLVTARKA
jgi:hypothetical protein